MAPKNNVCLDTILNELGEFGRFQKINFLLICIPVILAAIPAFSYAFAAGTPDYRCRIRECEGNVTEYMPTWIANAIPIENEKPSFCTRYLPVDNPNSTSINDEECPANLFNPERIVQCDDLVFPDRHTTIANDFDIYCKENQWLLTLIGTLNGIGQFICLPFAGMLSDRYGRKTVLIGSVLMSTIVGLIRSFSTSLKMFMFLEMADTTLGAAAYSTGFILGIELVGPSYRVAACAILSICFALGEIFLGAVAWYVDSWRTFLRIVYLPGLLIIMHYWCVPESLRWLISHNKFTEVQSVLSKISKVNKTSLSEKSLECLINAEDKTEQVAPASIMSAMKNKTLVLRFFNCSIAWITSTLTYYGLSLNSVAISGNKYINFISVAAAEIPAYILTTALLDRFGRRLTLSLSFLLVGIACTSFIFIPKGGYIQIIVFIAGKCASTIAFTSVYIFTTELFPTSVRHSVLGYCSMLGRFGGMIAPQTPLLALIWGPLPLLIFGSLATLASILALLFPETLNTELPDTIEQSENIKKQKRTVTDY